MNHTQCVQKIVHLERQRMLRKIGDVERDNRILRQRLRAIRRTLREFANQAESSCLQPELPKFVDEFVRKLREAGL